MTCTIVGTRRVDMESERVHGWSVYVNREDDGVNGMLAERHFISDDMIRRDTQGTVPNPGNIMDFEFNQRGKIGKIRELA